MGKRRGEGEREDSGCDGWRGSDVDGAGVGDGKAEFAGTTQRREGGGERDEAGMEVINA